MQNRRSSGILKGQLPMKKRIITLLLALVITAQVAFAGSVTNFGVKRTYNSNTFSDVEASMWYAENVADCYRLGLVDGEPGGLFNPEGYVTLAETIKLAVTIHSLYNAGLEFVPTQAEGEWFMPYVDYALRSGIIKSGYFDYNARAARSDFATILINALPLEETAVSNSVPDGAIPDVAESFSYGKAVYRLYRAGVLTGSGNNGEFYPNLPITRAEAATILLRMVDSTRRVYIQKAGLLTAEELYNKCAPAVVFIQVFDKDGVLIKRGSGFIINETGLVATNSHVIADAEYASVTLSTGEERKILGIYGYDMKTDCALIQIEGKGYPTLEIGRYTLKTGADIYTIGNPVGLVNSYSKGIISMHERELDGTTYIQIDAAISSGSSGGALLDAAGRVIGITSAAVNGGQSLNLAMPISVLDALDISKLYDLGAVPTADKLYEGYFPAPDFGAYADLTPSSRRIEEDGTLVLAYDLGYVLNVDKLMEGYEELLGEYMFDYYGASGKMDIYYNGLFGRIMALTVSGKGRDRVLTVEVF